VLRRRHRPRGDRPPPGLPQGQQRQCHRARLTAEHSGQLRHLRGRGTMCVLPARRREHVTDRFSLRGRQGGCRRSRPASR
jgi:hypothetical protein